eukprot:4032302-Amphidinium_carterae.2
MIVALSLHPCKASWQVFVGPPENPKEAVVSAAKAADQEQTQNMLEAPLQSHIDVVADACRGIAER